MSRTFSALSSVYHTPQGFTLRYHVQALQARLRATLNSSERTVHNSIVRQGYGEQTIQLRTESPAHLFISCTFSTIDGHYMQIPIGQVNG